jgi:hypothetical protein
VNESSSINDKQNLLSILLGNDSSTPKLKASQDYGSVDVENTNLKHKQDFLTSILLGNDASTINPKLAQDLISSPE